MDGHVGWSQAPLVGGRGYSRLSVRGGWLVRGGIVRTQGSIPHNEIRKHCFQISQKGSKFTQSKIIDNIQVVKYKGGSDSMSVLSV